MSAIECSAIFVCIATAQVGDCNTAIAAGIKVYTLHPCATTRYHPELMELSQYGGGKARCAVYIHNDISVPAASDKLFN
jgi:hypothetical protein